MDYAALGTAFSAWLKDVAPWHDALVAATAMLTQRKMDEGVRAKNELSYIQKGEAAVVVTDASLPGLRDKWK